MTTRTSGPLTGGSFLSVAAINSIDFIDTAPERVTKRTCQLVSFTWKDPLRID